MPLVWFGLSVQTLLLGMVSMCAKFESSRVRAKVWPGLVWFGLVLVWFWYGSGLVLVWFISVNIVAWYGEYVCKV